VAMRVLLPSSRLQNWKHRGAFIADFSELDNLQHYYRVLEQLQKDKEHIVAVINKAIAEKYQRAVTVCLYDVTTYAFESRIESEIRDFGMSKDHKVNEVQVVLGLVIDANGIPIDYELYRGDTNEFGTLCPTIKRITEKYKVQRIIVVADRGLNSGENLKQLQDIGCDFVIAQKVRSCDEETQQEILNDCWDETYMDFDEEGKTTGEIQFKAKTLEVKKPIREIKQSASGKNYPGKIIDWIDTRWIVTYSSKRAAKDNAELDRAIEKAQQCISQKNGKVSQKGWSSLIKRGASKGKAHLDQEKIAQKRRWAGYYAICTNMALKEKSSTEIVELYRQLWRIEDSFRITKTHLQARPVFVWNDKRIEGHFVVCYVALVLQRLMEYECHMKKTPMTTARILTALRTAMVVPHDIRHELFFTKFNVNEDFETLGRVFGLQTLSRYESKQALKKKLHLPRVTVQ